MPTILRRAAASLTAMAFVITSISAHAGFEHRTAVPNLVLTQPTPPAAAQLVFSVNSLSFGGYQVGATSPEQSIALSNQGTAAASLGPITTTGDYAATTGCGSSLAPAASCTIALRFSPTATGPRAGSVRVSSGGTTYTATLSGDGLATGGQQTSTAVVTDVALGSTDFAGAPRTGSATVTNTGNAPLTVTGVSGLSAPLALASISGCSNVPSGGTCQLQFQLDSSIRGTFSQQVTTTGAANNGTFTVSGSVLGALSRWGTGTANFGNVAVGNTGQALVTLHNDGNAAADFSTLLGLPATVSANASQCGAVSPGSSCQVALTWSPVSAGSFLVSNVRPQGVASTRAANALALTGVATQATVETSTATLAFGSVVIGETPATQTFQVLNANNSAVALSGVTTTSDYSAETNCGASLAANSACDVTVTFTPTSYGARNGKATVASPAGNVEVALTGAGVASLSVSPAVGVVQGGNVVQITTTQGGFGSSFVVYFDGVQQTDVTSINSTTLNVVTQGRAAGTVDVLVVGSSTMSWWKPAAYTYGTTSFNVSGPNLSGGVLALGSVASGTTTTSSLTVTNTSTTVHAPLNAVFSGNAEFFRHASSTCSASLAPQASCILVVGFIPQAAGSRPSGTLVISGADAPATLTLTGTGTVPVSYGTFSTSDKHASVSLTNGNLTATGGATANALVRSTALRAGGAGRYYFEVRIDAVNTANSNAPTAYIGVATTSASTTSVGASTFTGFQAQTAGANRALRFGKGGTGYTGTYVPATEDVIGVLTDFGTNTLTLYRGGVVIGTVTASGLYSVPVTWTPAAYMQPNTQVTFNFGASPWVNGLPAGASPWTN